MKLQVFSIYDTAAESYLQPFFTHNKATATRSFSELVDDPNTQFGRYPADYVLFQIADYDDQTGTITPLEANINLGIGIEFQQPAKLEAVQ